MNNVDKFRKHYSPKIYDRTLERYKKLYGYPKTIVSIDHIFCKVRIEVLGDFLEDLIVSDIQISNEELLEIKADVYDEIRTALYVRI